MMVRILLLPCLLAATLCGFQSAQATDDEGQPVEEQQQSPTPDNRVDCGGIVNPLYMKLFNAGRQPLAFERVRDYVNKAYKLLKSPAHRYVCYVPGREAVIINQIQLLHDIADENEIQKCDTDKMAKMKKLESLVANHITLGPYISYYNLIGFDLCARKLIEKLSLSQQIIRYTNIPNQADHLSKLSKLVAQRRQELIAQENYSIKDADDEDEDSLRNTSVCMMRYISETLNLDTEKPPNRSMIEHLNIVDQLEDSLINPDCAKLREIHHGDYARYQFYIKFYRQQLRYLFWRDEHVADLLEQLRICHQLDHANRHIYLLGQYDVDEIIALLENTHEPVNSPEQIRDLLEIGLHSVRAEIYLGYKFERDYVSECIALLVLSETSAEKCQAHYFRLVNQLMGTLQHNSNLLSYMRHYFHLQVVECLPGLQGALKDLTGGIRPEQFFDLLTVYNIFQDVTVQAEPSLRLYYDAIPFEIIRLAAGKMFDFWGMNLFSLKETDLVKLPPTTSRAKSLFQSCQLIMDRLRIQIELYALFIALDPQITSEMDHESLGWMSKYNICKSLFNF